MGQTKNWILLRGLGRGTGHWGSFVDQLKSRFPNDNFELLDLPGNGARHQEQSPLRIADYVKDLRSHSQFVKNGESFKILAISLGGMITVEWMREFPHEVKKAYLICTSSAGMSPFYERYQLNNYVKTLKLLRGSKDEVFWEKNVLEMVTNSHERRESEILSMIAYSKAFPMKMENIVRQMAAASRYRFPNTAPGEIRLIGSYGDRLVSPHCTLKIAEKWGMKAAMHPWAGHDIPIDDPHWLIEHLL